MGTDKKIEVKKEKKEKDEKSRELALRREKPYSLFQELDNYFNEMAHGFFDDWFVPFRFRKTQPYSLSLLEKEPFFRTPLANITEDDKSFNIQAELPGLDKENITISIHDYNLEIKGEKREEKKEEKEGEFVRKEYHSTSYHRIFNLPENIDEDGIDADLDKGVLKIRIAKKEPEKKERKIIDIK